MAGFLIPDRSEETLRRIDEDSFASPVPVRERDPEDVSEPRTRPGCSECNHPQAAHGGDGCTATVNVYTGGWSRAQSGDRRTGITPAFSSPGVVAYSYPCPCDKWSNR